MKHIKFSVLIVFFFGFWIQAAKAQNPPWPEDVKNLEFYLHTIDVSNHIYDNWGHTAIRVVDPSLGFDFVFNWGIFDFGKPIDFAQRFYRGHLDYKLGIYPYRQALGRYKFEQRTVWQDRLVLTDQEKKILLDRLRWNAKPENRGYRYQYFFDNCSTRPRDYIDEALNGVIKKSLENVPTSETFRDMVRSHYRTNPNIAVALDIIMNARIDSVMTRHEKMFLPLTLRKELLEFRDSKGMPILEEDQILFQFQKPADFPLSGASLYRVILGFPLLLAFLLPFIRKKRYAFPRRLPRPIGAFYLLYGLYTGILGPLLPLNWLFSEHLDLHHNANMWLFWPFDLILMILGGVILLKGRFPRFKKVGILLRGYALAHVLALLIFMILRLTGLVEQGVLLVLEIFGPFHLIAWGLIYHKYREGRKHDRLGTL